MSAVTSALPAVPFFYLLDLAYSRKTLHHESQLRFWFSMHSMLLGYSFKPRLNSHAVAGTAGSAMIISLNRCLHPNEPV